MSVAEDQVFVKFESPALHTPENVGASERANTSGSEVLSKLLSGSVTSCVSSTPSGPSTFILYIPSFRKIEPKPELEVKDETPEKETPEKDLKASSPNAVNRLLKTNPTKRGVKTCPQCFNKIGHRAKQCKHCSPSKRLQRRRKMQQKVLETRPQGSENNNGKTINYEGTADQLVDQCTNDVGNEVEETSDVNNLVEEAAVENIMTISEQNAADTATAVVTEIPSNETVVTSSACVSAGSDECQPQVSLAEETVPFAPSKEQETVVSTAAQPPDSFSLQDLICGLLAQNQGTLPTTIMNNDPPSETTTIAVQTDTDKLYQDSRPSEEPQQPQEEKRIEAADNSVDANSVALFLGQMAQQRNGKKRQSTASTNANSVNPQSQVITVMTGAVVPGTCSAVLSVKPSKFRKIQPKNNLDIPVRDEREEEGRDDIKEVRVDAQFRLMGGTATRRGVMACTKCQLMIGCRSKICKHCKTQITEDPPRIKREKGVSAVQLQLPESLNMQLFSVRKCKTGPELRCFVRVVTTSDQDDGQRPFYCDYPLCVMPKEPSNPRFVCEHVRACSAAVTAGVPLLDESKLDQLPLDEQMKITVLQLHQQCASYGLPLVQWITSKTLAVVDQSPDNASTDPVSFAHVRFDNVRGNGCFQRQVFCSGKTCMAWNFMSNSSNSSSSEVDRACSCIHYAACMWAIASDDSLERDFGIYLTMFVNKAEASGKT
ncbi:uncharacterized protein LOC116610626 [Nematostella vectensis]|uniref:uncharacterized protein LOC116610626 n=1 Tax=Nematostella vectensis TaxID=45351 RepID=UPI0020770B1D|nr:uncharacterized protein LOC116610626 [Nematostella vectensis]